MSVGERQRVEIVRCLLQEPRLLIMDEPTSVLTPQAVDKLFDTLRQLAAEGCSILYISHKLDEIRALCHRATVLRGGKVTGHVRSANARRPPRSRGMMIGGDLPHPRHRDAGGGDARARRRRPRRSQPTIRSARRSARSSHSPCTPARSSASPASRATARRNCSPRCRASARSRAPRRDALRQRVGDAVPRMHGAGSALRSCPRSGWVAAPFRRCRWPTTRS